MKRKHYEQELRRLQTGLCRLQDWIKHKGLRVVVLFEGRDAAGKGGTIKAITERVSPRMFRVVARVDGFEKLSAKYVTNNVRRWSVLLSVGYRR